MKKQTLPYPPGFVEPNTGRVAVLVREYARPKAQARTEAQLAEVDWAAVLAAC